MCPGAKRKIPLEAFFVGAALLLLFLSLALTSLRGLFWISILSLLAYGGLRRLLSSSIPLPLLVRRLCDFLINNRRRLTQALTVLACLFITLSALAMMPVYGRTFLDWAFVLMLIGGILLWLALLLNKLPQSLVLPWPTITAAPAINLHLPALIAGVFCLFLLAEINGDLLGIPLLSGASPHLQFALMCLGIIFTAWGLGGNVLSPPHRNGEGLGGGVNRYNLAFPISINFLKQSSRRSEVFLLILIALIAFALRVWNLENAIHTYIDEFHFVGAFNRLQAEPDIKLLSFFSPLASSTWIYPYLESWTLLIFGNDLLGLRVISAFMGVLTILTIYLLARTLFDRTTALIAALLLATFPPYIHFSRLAQNMIADPLFGSLALAFLARGFRFNRQFDFVLSGVFLGLTQYFYEGGKLLFPPLVIGWVVLTAIFYRQTIRGPWRNILLMLLAAVIVAAPLYYALLGEQSTLTPRMDSLGRPRDFYSQLLTSPDARQSFYNDGLLPSLLHFTNTPDISGYYYGGETPLILVYMVPLFLLGLFHAFRLRHGGFPLILWPLLTVLGNTLILSPGWSSRYVVVLPVLPLIMAVGLRYTWKLLADTSPPRFTPVVNRIVMAFILCLALVQPIYYFGPHLDYINVQVRHDGDMIDMAYRARAFPPGTRIVLITNDVFFWPYFDTMRQFWDYELNIVEQISPDDLTPAAFDDLPRDSDYAFFLESDDTHSPEILRRAGFQLLPPSATPYNVPPHLAYWLYYAPFKNDN